ncbi:hypothetical protein [Neobacillus niacini]|uniref:hypothetical protein n=1 Tax=Neobacillus niacini TaxID=86668 RepID=UPI00285C8D39|nr:hypothetical protein [Neobacillus niacini]MDR6999109.1 hypothetical protein [Neobacillus niacini]
MEKSSILFQQKGDGLMKNHKLEYIKIACLVVIAVSLSVIAWKTVSQVNVLQEIQESLNLIGIRVNELK